MPFYYFVPVPHLDAAVSDQSHQVRLLEYLAHEGQAVAPGSPLALVATHWAVVRVDATTNGFVTRLLFPHGGIVHVGDPIAIITCDGEDAPGGRPRSAATVVSTKLRKPDHSE